MISKAQYWPMISNVEYVHNTPPYIQIAKVMVKMNKLDSAIQFLQTAKKTDYYLHPRFGTCFNTCVDGHLQDIVEKKLRGYYYKPRKNKGKTTL